MKRLPQKTSLVTQTVEVILEEIETGRWTGSLPGEHELCKQLHVSRTTLRAALDQLNRQGMIKSRQGSRREIIPRRRRSRKAESNRVVLLMPDPLQAMLIRAFLIDRLRERLAEEGYLLETHVSRIPFRARSPLELEKLTNRLRPAGWVLMGSTEMMQKWFAARHLPCVVAGTPYENVKLSSVDVDYGAVCHHAVGQFVARGHRRIVLLNPHPGAAGEAVTEAGFSEAALKFKSRGVEASIVRHNGTLENACSRIATLMARNPSRAAFLVSRARHALTVLCYLSQKGFQVPKDVAVISRDDEPFLEDVVPTVARYSHNPSVFAAKLSQAVIEMVHGNRRVRDHKILSRFIPGQTLG
jgi:DNA-binding LacI/PurR family transcriptional regulator